MPAYGAQTDLNSRYQFNDSKLELSRAGHIDCAGSFSEVKNGPVPTVDASTAPHQRRYLSCVPIGFSYYTSRPARFLIVTAAVEDTDVLVPCSSMLPTGSTVHTTGVRARGDRRHPEHYDFPPFALEATSLPHLAAHQRSTTANSELPHNVGSHGSSEWSYNIPGGPHPLVASWCPEAVTVASVPALRQVAKKRIGLTMRSSFCPTLWTSSTEPIWRASRPSTATPSFATNLQLAGRPFQDLCAGPSRRRIVDTSMARRAKDAYAGSAQAHHPRYGSILSTPLAS
ncbi:hypothetical protein NUW54_g5040 [Trametes sanguinea]|uniref:Uncharacterized protein n=2 Tax=Trametes sanguinea TaxID=158606 RepID=A0ACC1PW64_9APHY|nr:hypothetical protein NUW54_g6871 [Trametes sanguinea]KAJ3003958.1 hypothetical protein NUW54_g5040 [Trametes sanguinea]